MSRLYKVTIGTSDTSMWSGKDYYTVADSINEAQEKTCLFCSLCTESGSVLTPDGDLIIGSAEMVVKRVELVSENIIL